MYPTYVPVKDKVDNRLPAKRNDFNNKRLAVVLRGEDCVKRLNPSFLPDEQKYATIACNEEVKRQWCELKNNTIS